MEYDMMVYEKALRGLIALTQADNPEHACQVNRYKRLLLTHQQVYNTRETVGIASAPGRVEIIGNHTDHNHGLVLAAAVNMDTVAAFSRRNDMNVHLASEGYEAISVDLSNLNPMPQEAGTSKALIRGVAAGLSSRGHKIGGFEAVMSSQVLSGSGLSSSAAFKVLVCYLFDLLYNGGTIDAVTRAQISQYAENAYFMKPCGLMDQMASSFGGMVQIDFELKQPKVESLQFSFAKAGYQMVIVNTRSSHDDLTPAYSAIPQEMKAAAQAAGGELLRDIPFDGFLAALPMVQEQTGDRAVLRALHFYQENDRVREAAKALKNKDINTFFDLINASGLSSWTQLQNISAHADEQPIALGLAVAKQVLQRRGACRVHGGGFAGTTLNFEPNDLRASFINAMEALFGAGCCHLLDVREKGPDLIL
ncbi:MAG: galactokinase [Clostridiales bacterium]|nr:galactokinase [Clostridiales bacterium]